MKVDMENFNNSTLPNVELTNEEINQIGETFIKSIIDLKRRNKNIQINVSDEELKELYNNHNSTKTIRGVKHALILRDICLRSIQKDLNIDTKEIIEDIYIYNGSNFMIAVGTDSVVAHKIYLTKETLYIYGMDIEFNIAYKKIIEIEGINKVGTKKLFGIKGDDIWFIDTKEEEIRFQVGNEKTDILMKELIKSLGELGVKMESNKWNWSLIIYLIISGVIFLVFSLMILINGMDNIVW